MPFKSVTEFWNMNGVHNIYNTGAVFMWSHQPCKAELFWASHFSWFVFFLLKATINEKMNCTLLDLIKIGWGYGVQAGSLLASLSRISFFSLLTAVKRGKKESLALLSIFLIGLAGGAVALLTSHQLTVQFWSLQWLSRNSWNSHFFLN